MSALTTAKAHKALAYVRMRRRSRDRSVPNSGGMKTHRIDLGLALLSVLRQPDVTFTQQEIAEWCGCTYGMIYLIERNALKRVRNLLRFGARHDLGKELVA